jgi:hypothetical protein
MLTCKALVSKEVKNVAAYMFWVISFCLPKARGELRAL